MTIRKEDQPQRVSGSRFRTSPGGDVRDRWSWTEPSVWTRRMLTALENGVQGGKWHSLVDKVYQWENLEAAYRKVAANKGSAGVDHVTTTAFGHHLDANLTELHNQLRTGTYRPQSIRRVHIPKPGSSKRRPLGIPTIRDRVVQTALKHVLEPIFERTFAEQSYGFRPGRSCKDALRRVDALLEMGYQHIVDADLQSYFDTLDHERLLSLLSAKVSDRRIAALVGLFLKQDIMECPGSYTPEAGSPQGGVISPLLSNMYLDELDHLMADRGFEMVRYADDFVVLCRSAEEAEAAMSQIKAWVEQAHLTLHPKKTQIVTCAEGFDFLGYHFRAGQRWPSKKSLRAVKDRIVSETKRTSGRSLDYIIGRLNTILKGWYNYYKHCHRWIFYRLDQWIRMRIRSVLRRRSGRQGRSRGPDHQRWKNAFFAELGLFSLKVAQESDRQSSSR